MATSGQKQQRSKNHSREASLDFENTVQNRSLQPCDLNGFMDYLYYVERRAENLQFFLWYCDYVDRWSQLLPQQRQMAPVWGPAEAAEAAQEDAEAAAAAAATAATAITTTYTIAQTYSPLQPPPQVHRQHMLHSRGPSASSSHGRRNLSMDAHSMGFPYGMASGPYKPRSNSVASTATAASVSSMASVSSHLSTSSRLAASIHQRSDNDKLANILTILENLSETAESVESAEPTGRPADVSLSMVSPRAGPPDWQIQPHTLQPFRDELERVVSHYIAATGDRALPDLFPPERAACLRAAKRTTHPSALLPAFLTAESALREQSFAAFVRDWCVGNAEKGSPRLVLVQIIATMLFLAGLALDVVLVLFASTRKDLVGSLPRLVCLAFWWPALAALLAAWRKIDLLLYVRGQRLLRPWEVEDDSDDDDGDKACSPLYSYDIENDVGPHHHHQHHRQHQHRRGHRHQTSTSSTSSRIDPLRKASLQALGPRNDPDSDAWAVRQARMPLYRQLLVGMWTASRCSQTVAVQHPCVRAMQTRAVWAAALWAGLLSCILAVVSLFIPGM